MTSALSTIYFDIASESDVVKPGNDMPLLCLPMAACAKLRCRRRLSRPSFLSKTFVYFGGLSDIVQKSDKINNDGESRESPLSRWLW